MTILRDIIVWTSIALVMVASACAWVALMVAVMLWPLPSISILCLVVVTLLAAVHIVQVRLDAANTARGQRPPATVERNEPATAVAGDVDPLMEILGAELFRELSALGVPQGPIKD